MASMPSLSDDLTCPVCCGIFKDPLILSCSHSFCKGCLKKRWREKETTECPVCKNVEVNHPAYSLALKRPFLVQGNRLNTDVKEEVQKSQKSLRGKLKAKLHAFKSNLRRLFSFYERERMPELLQLREEGENQSKSRLIEQSQTTEKSLWGIETIEGLNIEISTISHTIRVLDDNLRAVNDSLEGNGRRSPAHAAEPTDDDDDDQTPSCQSDIKSQVVEMLSRFRSRRREQVMNARAWSETLRIYGTQEDKEGH